jgi:hypothetical protein
MRKSAGSRGRTQGLVVFLGILLLPLVAGLAQIVENPAKPTAKNAGRVLNLTEVWRITDKGGEFYFQSPRRLQIAFDGTIFVADEKEFLRFSADGKFLKNIYKGGQGPGEIGGTFFHSILGRELFIQDLNSWRLWRTDLNGVFQEQINLKKRDAGYLIGVVPEGFLFQRVIWPPRSEWTGRLVDVPYVVDLHPKDGSEIREVARFNGRAFLSGGSATSWDSRVNVVSPDRQFLYAYFGRDYLIEVVDLAAGKIIKRFKRTYPKIPHEERRWEADFRKKNGSPKIEYETDIWGLYPVGGNLWVATSTVDKAKGRLIDVFDEDGRFIDNFYLGTGRSLMAIREDFILCEETNEDETITIVKYRITRPS